MRRFMVAALTACCCLLPILAHGQPQMNENQRARYQHLIEELRCLVCQNQNIAESNAPLAEDLRHQVAEMIIAGRSNDEIKAYVVDRYGDFILYRPPFKPMTWLLWLGPFLLLLLALVIAIRLYRKPDEPPAEALDKDRLDAILREDQSDRERDS